MITQAKGRDNTTPDDESDEDWKPENAHIGQDPTSRNSGAKAGAKAGAAAEEAAAGEAGEAAAEEAAAAAKVENAAVGKVSARELTPEEITLKKKEGDELLRKRLANMRSFLVGGDSDSDSDDEYEDEDGVKKARKPAAKQVTAVTTSDFKERKTNFANIFNPRSKPLPSANNTSEEVNNSGVSVKLVEQAESQNTTQDIRATTTSSSKKSGIPKLKRPGSNNSTSPIAKQPPSTITSSPSKKPLLSRASKIPLPTNKLSTLRQRQTLTRASAVEQTEPQKPMEQQLPTTTPVVQSAKIFRKPKVLPEAPIPGYNEEERQFPNNRQPTVRKISRSRINQSNKPFVPKNQPTQSTFQTRMSEGLESPGSIKDLRKIEGEDDFWNALDNGLKIEGQHPIVWCSKNKYLIEDIDPIIYAIQNKIKIEGKHAFGYALDNGLTIEGKHPIVSCAERGVKIPDTNREFHDPILWAEQKGYKINEETPIQYAIKNSIQIEQQNPILWAFRQKDPKINGLVERVTVTINLKKDGFVKSLNTKIPSEPGRRTFNKLCHTHNSPSKS
ncbi:MAG: hypothetical protein EB127_18300 [Alphaproteobacteria bacterium]|nr:hypothetical protein [Alphaproteobacteria bacterium]